MTGAAGAVEAAFSLLAMEHGLVPPTINLENPEEGLPLKLFPTEAIEADLKVVMSNSFGFGGTNVSLVMRKYEGV